MSETVHEIKVGEVAVSSVEDVYRKDKIDDWKQYNGRRVAPSSTPSIAYLIMNGQLRAIPDTKTYNRLFVDPNGIQRNDKLVESIPMGEALSFTSMLAKAEGGTACYLVTNCKKMYIPSGEIFTKFNFSQANIVGVDAAIFDNIPTGEDVG